MVVPERANDGVHVIDMDMIDSIDMGWRVCTRMQNEQRALRRSVAQPLCNCAQKTAVRDYYNTILYMTEISRQRTQALKLMSAYYTVPTMHD